MPVLMETLLGMLVFFGIGLFLGSLIWYRANN